MKIINLYLIIIHSNFDLIKVLNFLLFKKNLNCVIIFIVKTVMGYNFFNKYYHLLLNLLLNYSIKYYFIHQFQINCSKDYYYRIHLFINYPIGQFK